MLLFHTQQEVHVEDFSCTLPALFTAQLDNCSIHT